MTLDERLKGLRERLEKFTEIMSKGIAAEDVDSLCERLSTTGFFTAPASTRFHGAYEGGLFDHSYAVTSALLNLTEKLGLPWSDPRSPYIVGMFHDMCKCDSYVATNNGFEYNKNQLLTGHGDKSVILVQELMSGCTVEAPYLTDEEKLCIRWHMGAFDEKANWNSYNKAIEAYPTVLYMHTADMIASQIMKI